MPVMCQMEREQKIECVNFFAQQVKSRVWDSFDDFDQQVQVHDEMYYRKFRSATGSEYFDEADIAEFAFDESIKFSELLYELRRDLTLASVAALYHQWEKDLKQFLSRELRYYAENSDQVWKATPNDILGWLEKQGWSAQSYHWFPMLDACRLIVNVYKHGKGGSLDKLKNEHPQYLNHSNQTEDGHSDHKELDVTHLDFEDIYLTVEHFDQFVEAVKQFWSTFPEQLYLEST